MIDKQIIIDGVDVAGCEFFWNRQDAKDLKLCKINFDNNYFSNGIPLVEKCSKHNNCYYKQLKRKEQDCERLKKFLNEIRDEELKHLDIEWDEYETSVRKYDYSNIITLVERALGEIDD